MATRSYRVRVVRGDIQIEAEGDKSFVLDMLRRFAQEGSGDGTVRERAGSTQKGATQRPRVPEPTKAVSPGEFVRQLGFKKHTECGGFEPAAGRLVARHAAGRRSWHHDSRAAAGEPRSVGRRE